MTLDRRTFNTSLLALGFGIMFPNWARAAGAGGVLSTGYDVLHARHMVSRLTADLDIAWDLALPARGHGTAVRPTNGEGLVVARRPGMYAVVFGLVNGDERITISPAPGRHFYGHGVYSSDGRILWMSENDFDGGRGVIGVYDAENGYARVGEFESGGIGPHQFELMDDGKTLAIANGGILTRPDRGREKLNLDTLRPSLAYIDGASGRITDQVFFETARAQKLSIRHMTTLPGGRIAVGCQDQVSDGTSPPLVYLHDRTNSEGLRPVQTPPHMLRRFNGYCGSVVCDGRSGTLAASSPRGGLIGFWALPSGKWAGHIDLTDGCGLAPERDGGFMASSGKGTLGSWGADTRPAATAKLPFRRWDNHMTVIDA